ncbi:nitronate monooxygenase family protein [Pseudomaricurvus sp. HS19]|uniref:NAD(P)H-dependent flavin oxidoreductase n=1 Tax=Pseudomaricurvus sp. HS19 TaxID=2692626 RepID=UPI00136FA461|nr:nitronate monooxygenase [Pseudomaricurvus sp. HS19]MYM63376.1 DUF561 domain-containing protein [Pseudomaricurvus sp. HS19]
MIGPQFTDLFGVEYPLIQAPMAGAQDHRLAVAVSQAGGLGSIPCATLDADAIKREVSAFRAQSEHPLNLNFFCHQPPAVNHNDLQEWYALLAPYCAELDVDVSRISTTPARHPFNSDLTDVVEELQPEVVSFHFGLPEPGLLQRVRASGARVIASATTTDEALWLQARGADAVIVQGTEAGGHRGHFLSHDLHVQESTLSLLPKVVAQLEIPVIAAGGIASQAEIAAVMALGAAGVQIGTAYLLCTESMISPLHRLALMSEPGLQTEITNVFTGRPARGIVNRLMKEIGPLCDKAPAFPLAANLVNALRAAAEQNGSADFSPLWSGENRAGCREVSATELTHQLMGLL